VGCLYWSTSRAKEDLDGWGQSDANKAVANTVQWLKYNDYRNVIVDADNEGMSPWNVGQMCAAGHEVDNTIMIGNNEKTTNSQCDLNIHFGPKESHKPWFNSEATPGNASGGYWGSYSKETHQSNSSYYNYSRIGRYTSDMKNNQYSQTRDGMDNWDGHMLASTWLQCAPNEGVGGPFNRPGGLSNISDVNSNIEDVHPDAGILWWLEYIKSEYGGAWGPPPPLDGNNRPTADAGQDISVTLPTNTAALTGSGEDSDGTISAYKWEKVSGPDATMAGATSASLTISNLVPGTYTFRLTVIDDKGATSSDEVKVTVIDPKTREQYFLEQNGLLVVEAENFHEKFARTAPGFTQEHYYELKTDKSDYSGAGFMQLLPDEFCENGCTHISSPRDKSGAEMIWRIKIETAGQYKIWVRGMSIGGESNGTHVGIDNTLPANGPGSNMSGFRPHNEWVWEHGFKDYSVEPVLDISASEYTLHMWQRDDGFRVDKILLGINQNAAPSGQGPEESEQVGGTTALKGKYVLNANPRLLRATVSQGQMMITYSVPSTANRTPLSISIYDVHSRLVRDLVNRDMVQGMHTVTWDGRDESDVTAVSGIYVVRFQNGNAIESRKIFFP
jgi:hypothetical protein